MTTPSFEHTPECLWSKATEPLYTGVVKTALLCTCGADARREAWNAAVDECVRLVFDWDVRPTQAQLVGRMERLKR